MGYTVKLTKYATQQLYEAVSYISKVLLEPDIAVRWADYLENAIASLHTMPARYPLLEEKPWGDKGIRKMPVKNFLVYYFINKEEKIVWVTAVLYGRRDQLSALRNMPI